MAEIDWSTGIYRPTAASEAAPGETFRLAICGDWAPLSEHQRALAENAEAFYGDLLPLLRSSDLNAVNFEGAFVDSAAHQIVKDGLPIPIPTHIAQSLSAAPFHLACLANNHVLDYGSETLQATQDLLSRQGIAWVGAGMNAAEAEAARFFQFGETRLAVLNLAEAEEARAVGERPGAAGLDIARAEAQLQSLAGQADVRVVIVHAGREHIPAPAPYIRQWYRALVDAGANLVIGHHPHVPQGVEIYRGAPIAYSLGNFTLYVKSPLRYHTLGYCVSAQFHGKALREFQIWPYRIAPDRLHLLKGNERTDFLEELQNLSRLIMEPGRLEAVWQAFGDVWLERAGLDDLCEGLAEMGMGSRMALAALKNSLLRYQGKGLGRRVMRRAILAAMHWLEKRPQPDFSDRSLPIGRHWSGENRALTEGSALPATALGAAILRNRFDTPAHRELYLTALGRVMDGSVGSAPEWAAELLKKWGLHS